MSNILESLFESKKTIIVLGAGGVGKTTASAAIALQGAFYGKRVLCLTIDPAKRLANSLGLETLPNQGKQISNELFAQYGLSCSGELHALVLDKKKTFDDLLKRHTDDPERLQRILDNRLYRYISTSLAGTHEYMAMEKLHALLEEDYFELIVVDTPPASDVFGFIDAPDRLVGAIDSPATRWMIKALGDTSRFSLNVLSRGAAVLLKALARITGAAFMEEIAGFLVDFNTLFGGFRTRAMMVKSMLERHDFAYAVVTSTSPPALFELQEVSRRLTRRNIGIDLTIYNRVQPAPSPYDTNRALQELQSLDLPANNIEVLFEKMQKAYAQEQRRAELDRQLIAEGTKRQGQNKSEGIILPLLDEDVHDLKGLAELGRALDQQSIEER